MNDSINVYILNHDIFSANQNKACEMELLYNDTREGRKEMAEKEKWGK